jgi:hypothetical protein
MRKSFVELQNDLGVFFPDNTTQFITPAKVREYLLEFLNAIRPAYGVLTQNPDRVQTVGTTPVKMLWAAQSDSDANQTSSSFVNGEITRAERGTSTINFTTDFECATGRFLTFTLYKNGSPTAWRITGNGAGAGNPIAVALTAIDYADPAAIYSIYITAEVAGVSVTLRSAALIISVDPVNSFT